MSKNVNYYDRFGKTWIAKKNSRIKDRLGVFGITFNQRQKLLLTYPSFDLSWPQLPGGGVEEHESHEQALLREFNEEVGPVQVMEVLPLFDQQVYYYADDKKEFWRYTQFFYLVKLRQAMVPHFGRWCSPENAKAAWVQFSTSLRMHYIHKRALKQVLRSRDIQQFYR